LLTCQSNRFIDTSTNAFAITRKGDVAVRQINPFIPDPTASTYGSAFFDGTGDYLNTPSNASFTFGTGDLTLECWIYQTATSVSTYRVIFGDDVYGSSGGYTLYSYNNALNLWKGGSGGVEVIAPAGTITLNVWNHVAWTRSGSSNRLFINGTQVGATTTDATNYTSTRSYIGASQAGSLPFTGYISNLRIVKGTAVYTAAFTPPTAPLTAITNTSLLTLQTNQAINNNLFIDDSTNNFAVTRAGNTTQGTFSPYGANWSNYFDGTGDYLSVPSSAALNLTGDFTLETWIYPTTINSYNMILGSSGTVNPDYFTIRASSIELGITTNSNYPVWNYSFVTNTWYYIVISRASGALKAFVNGQQLTLSSGSANDSSQIFPSGFTNFIGRYAVPEVPHYFTGYISNLRVVKGTAVYTSTFTPSTAPLTAISGTSLLTCQSNRLRDASTNNFTITKAGDVRVQRFSPFSPSAAYSLSTIGGSAYFDGTGDYLSVNTANAFGSGTGSFTAEFWVYPFSSSVVNLVDFRGSAGTGSTQLRIAFGAAAINPNKIIAGWVSDNQLISTSNVVLNAWTHVAVVRNGTSASLYINGVAESTITNSTAITDSGTYIGAYRGTEAFLNGYLSNLRVVSGTAVYTANFTPPTAPVTAITNTSLLLNFTDAGVVDNAMINNLETVGDARVSREVSKFGSGAMYFDGTGDYLKTPSSPNLGFGTGDFTVECWINTSTKNIVILDPRTSNSEPGVFFIQSTTGFIGYYDNTVGSLSGTTNVTTGAWFHLAWSRSGTTFRMFVNGTQEYSGTNSGNFGTSRPAVIGASWEISAFVNGYIDDLRITKGVARYTANFTAPTSALQIK